MVFKEANRGPRLNFGATQDRVDCSSVGHTSWCRVHCTAPSSVSSARKGCTHTGPTRDGPAAVLSVDTALTCFAFFCLVRDLAGQNGSKDGRRNSASKHLIRHPHPRPTPHLVSTCERWAVRHFLTPALSDGERRAGLPGGDTRDLVVF